MLAKERRKPIPWIGKLSIFLPLVVATVYARFWYDTRDQAHLWPAVPMLGLAASLALLWGLGEQSLALLARRFPRYPRGRDVVFHALLATPWFVGAILPSVFRPDVVSWWTTIFYLVIGVGSAVLGAMFPTCTKAPPGA